MAINWANLLGSIANAGATYYGASKNASATADAAAATAKTPVNVNSNVLGSTTFNKDTGTYDVNSTGPSTSPYAGANPELIAALEGLNNTDAATADRLTALRGLSAPDENLARNRMDDKLFARGQLGGTGGALQQEALYKAQAQADQQRQLTAADWAQNRALTKFTSALSTVGQGQAAQAQEADKANALAKIGIAGDQSQNPGAAMAAANASTDPLKALLASLGGAGGAGGAAGGVSNILSALFGGNGSSGTGGGILSSLFSGGGSGGSSGGVGGFLSNLFGGGSSAAGGDAATANLLDGLTASGGAYGTGAAEAAGTGGSGFLSSLFGGGGGSGTAAASGGSASSGGILSALGGSSGLIGAGALAAAPIIWNQLGDKMSKGTNAFQSPANWDASYYNTWTPDEQRQYNQAIANPVATAANIARNQAYYTNAGTATTASLGSNSPKAVKSSLFYG